MISSPHNPKIQWIRALQTRREERQSARAFVVEGVRLIEEAYSAGWKANLVLYSQQLSPRGRLLVEKFAVQGVEVDEISPKLMEGIADTESPQGLLAVLEQEGRPLPTTLDFVMIVDGMRDPGNLGTLLRTSAAAGIQVVLLSPGTTDAFAPKVLRSAMGAHFRFPILTLQWEEIYEKCKYQQVPALKLFLAEMQSGLIYWQADLRLPLGLVIGGEAEGASEFAHQHVDEILTIPMPGGGESLNASVAASILIYEVVRQRQL